MNTNTPIPESELKRIEADADKKFADYWTRMGYIAGASSELARSLSPSTGDPAQPSPPEAVGGPVYRFVKLTSDLPESGIEIVVKRTDSERQHVVTRTGVKLISAEDEQSVYGYTTDPDILWLKLIPAPQSIQEEPSVREQGEELWDAHSEQIGDHVSDMDYWSGRTVMIEDQFHKALQQFATPPPTGNKEEPPGEVMEGEQVCDEDELDADVLYDKLKASRKYNTALQRGLCERMQQVADLNESIASLQKLNEQDRENFKSGLETMNDRCAALQSKLSSANSRIAALEGERNAMRAGLEAIKAKGEEYHRANLSSGSMIHLLNLAMEILAKYPTTKA